jgi:UDP-N-acetyl-D-galactosamine dehydrogenase
MKNSSIGIIGLGYVGLPLAAAFASKYQVIGFDINEKRITELNKGLDSTNELTPEQLNKVIGSSLKLTTVLEDVSDCTTLYRYCSNTCNFKQKSRPHSSDQSNRISL